MKRIIENYIRRKNPNFEFDERVTNRLLWLLFKEKFFCLVRGVFFYLKRFRKPKSLILGKKIKFFYTKNMNIGTMVKIDDGAFLSALGTGKLFIGDRTSIGAYSRLEISMTFNNLGEFIHIGNDVGLGQFACLGGAGGLTIGDNCIIGPYLSCHPENHNFGDPDVLIKNQGVTRKGITIGENCWIGAKVTVLDGVTIGANCVIAAGAVITKDMPENSVIGGVPAKVIKSSVNHLKQAV